jgi:hypothetical protein
MMDIDISKTLKSLKMLWPISKVTDIESEKVILIPQSVIDDAAKIIDSLSQLLVMSSTEAGNANAKLERQQLAKPAVEKSLIDACKLLLENRQGAYTAKNGKQVGIEDENGEKMWISAFDDFFELETAIAAYDALEEK